MNVVLDGVREGSGPDAAASFEAPRSATPKKLSEILALTGGPGGGDWKWARPALQLGATRV